MSRFLWISLFAVVAVQGGCGGGGGSGGNGEGGTASNPPPSMDEEPDAGGETPNDGAPSDDDGDEVAEPVPPPGAPPGPPPLPDEVSQLATALMEAGSVNFPRQPTAVGSMADIAVEPEATVTVRTESGITQRWSGGSISSAGPYRLYLEDNASDFLMISEADGSSGLGYSAFGVWAESNVPDLLQADETLPAVIDGSVFYGGVLTPLAQMPTAGEATYAGSAIGGEVDAVTRGLALLAGSARFTADFAAGTVSGGVELENATYGGSWGTVSVAAAPISGNAFASDAATSSRGHRGTVDGRFHGPNAQEIGGSFFMRNEDSTIAASFGAGSKQVAD